MSEHDQVRGPLADEKTSDQSPRGERQPEAAEVESARTLADQARERLQSAGLDDPTIEQLADRYIAEGRGEDLDAFVDWARENAPIRNTSDAVDETSEQSFPASDPPSSWATSGGSG